MRARHWRGPIVSLFLSGVLLALATGVPSQADEPKYSSKEWAAPGGDWGSRTNASTLPHAISARDGSWSTVIQPGASASVTIAKPGTYEYVCTDHPWSIGQLIVE